MIDLDMDLKRAFDQRLRAYIAPAPAARPRASRAARFLVGAGVATLIFAGAGLAMDVESVAAANGGGCANLLAKVQLWVKKVSGEVASPLDVKTYIAKLARVDGCDGPKVDPDPAKAGANPKAIEIPQTKPEPKAP